MLSALTASSVSTSLLLGRLVVAGVFVAHGWNHIFGGGRIRGTADWFERLGMRPGVVHAWAASITEIGSGILLVAGLMTPIAGAGIVGVMLVAWVTNHRGNGFFVFRPGEGWEYVMVLTMLGVLFGSVGPGQWSIDQHVTVLRDLQGWPGFGISLGGGGGGALSILALCWRPARVTAGA